jgi:serine/threonine-protein kinase
VAWLDASGKMQPLVAPPSTYSGARVSPDGRKLAYTIGGDLYVRNLDLGTTTRVTFSGNEIAPVWAPDGKHVVCESVSNHYFLYWFRSDGSGDPLKILEDTNTLVPWSFSPDGRRLAYRTVGPDTGSDIWTLPLDLTDSDHPKPGKPEPFLRTPADEIVPRFSPDGRWIAYRSNESGIDEIYVRPFPPGSGAQWQISNNGGLYGLWSSDGRQLFYEAADNRIMVLDYTVHGAAFVPGNPRLWSNVRLFFTGTANLDLAPDGERFAVLTLPEATGGEKASVHVTMLENFFDEVKRKLP